VLSSSMAGSMKDALRKSGLVPEEPKPPARRAKEFLEELPDDETLPPLFEPPASTKLHPRQPGPTKK
jgi:hypothetical protein